MLEVSDKLKKFSEEVLTEAGEKSKKEWSDFELAQKQEFERFEMEYLEESYHKIQNGCKKIDKEKSGKLSKSRMANKRRLLQTRVRIIDSVFSDVRKKLEEFVASKEYTAFLEKRIRDTQAALGEGNCQMIITERDFEWLQPHASSFAGIVFEAASRRESVEMIGGCKGYHLTKKLFFDNSFEKQMKNYREHFLQDVASELKIED